MVENGKQALEAVGQRDFDVVLMDVQMPVMDGFQATQTIRKLADPKKARLPIVAMTAHALKGDAERCLGAGMDAYVSKPVKGEELIELIETLADRSPSVTANGVSSAPVHPQATSSPAASIFDPDLALKRCLNKRDLLQQMIAFFFKDADDSLPSMRTALQAGDLMEVGRLGHRLKGSIAHIGAEAASQAALHVERFLLHAGDKTDAGVAVRALERECEVLKAALIEYKATISPAEGSP